MMMLALSKKLIKAHKSVIDGEYEKLGLKPTITSQKDVVFNWTNLTNLDILYKKKLGIIGLGEIGVAVAKRARAFEMSVLYYDVIRRNRDEEQDLQVQYNQIPSSYKILQSCQKHNRSFLFGCQSHRLL